MTDVHIHILNGLDDGSRSVDESLRILRELSLLGFTDVICTPHFVVGSDYCANNITKNRCREILQAAADAEGIKIKLHPGNEVFVDPEMGRFLALHRAQAMPDGRHVLFEMPFENMISGMGGIVADLKRQGYIPIVAHPERYAYFQENFELARKFHDLGVQFQCNFGSAIGVFGSGAKKTLRRFLKAGLVDYLGTDIHRPKSEVVQNFAKIERRIRRVAGSRGYAGILQNNERLVKG